MSKIELGTRCRVVYTRSQATSDWVPGVECVVVGTQPGITPLERPYDCIVEYSGGIALVIYEQLSPIIDPPKTTTWEHVAEDTGWNPAKQPTAA